MKLKTVIHVHTNYSLDSNNSPGELLATALRRGVNCVAVTDHDEIDGALEAAALSQERYGGAVRIIVGQEVTSRNGHIIGLFLQERVTPGLSVEATAEAIHAQGGLVLAPHPFMALCRHALGRQGLKRLQPYLHAIEVCNAQSVFPLSDRKALRFSQRHNVAAFTGADAHLRGHLDPCYQLLSDFHDAVGFLSSLRSAELVHGRFGPRYLAEMSHFHSLHKLTGQLRPGFGVNARRKEQRRRILNWPMPGGE